MEWRTSLTALDSPIWSVSVFVAIVLAIVMFLMLRKYEAKLVSPSVGRTLLTLRVLALLLLLFTLLKPVLTKALDIEKQQRLIVGIDVSDSMDTADRHAAPEEMLRWAQALRMLGNTETEELLQQWIDAYENGQQPDWDAGAGANAEAADDDGVQQKSLREQQVQEVFDEFAGMPRTEFVRRLLQGKPNELLDRLQQERIVDLRVFGADQQTVADDQLQELLKTDRHDLHPGATDVVNLLTTSIGDEDSDQIQGIVILTDGRQTVPADAAAEASRLGALGIPIYCVPIGSRLSPRDLSIASVQVPQSVFLEDTAQLNATITSTGYAGDDVTVLLKKDGEVVDQKTVTVAADFFEVEFGIPTNEVGNHDYTVSTEVQPGELRDDNNARDFTVSVVDNQSRVLILEGDARWEFRYLQSALERDKRVDLSTVLFRQPYLQLLNRTFMDNTLPDDADLEEQLAKTDLLIIGDVRPTDISDSAWTAIESAVSDDGLTVLVIPGRRHMPQEFDSPILNQLLPVSDFRQQLAERYKRTLPGAAPSVFRMQPTPAAGELTVFELNGTDIDQRMELAGLPGHPWAYTGTPKPVASVWANLSMEGVDLDDELATVVHQYYGFGQVVWLGIDSTWRWRLRAGDTWHHRFWGQLVRWAAGNKSAAGNDQVRMTMSGIVVDDTDSVDVSVRWNPKLVPQLNDATVEVIVEAVNVQEAEPDDATSPSAASQTIQLLPMDGAPERFSGKLPELRPGSYEVRLNLKDSRLKLDQEIVSELLVRQQLSTELANISCHREFLQQISSLSNGLVLEPWQLADLPDLLRSEDTTQNVIDEIRVWDHWGLLLLFFVLLTAEWILRKLHGLP